MQVNNTKSHGLGTSVVNLTKDFTLSENQKDILAKGLKFVPTPKHIPEEKFENSIENLKRRIRLNWTFRDEKNSVKIPFTGKSSWTPPDRFIPKEILDFEKHVDNILKSSIPLSNKNNFSIKQNKALEALKNTENIIIKSADKGGATVIMQKTEYEAEAMRQLNNPRYYRKIDSPLTDANSKFINTIILDLQRKKFLTKKQVNFLKPPPLPRPRQFYLLPKIHKPIEKWSNPGYMPPGRPIVSDCSSESYQISQYIDNFLQPLSVNHATYIKNTTDFLQKIRNIEIPENAILFSLDVDSLYTNIDTKQGLSAIRNAFNKNPDLNRPDTDILKLLESSLTKNDFVFNGLTYLQVSGTAMGVKFAPAYANIYVAELEEEALKKCDKKPLVFFRYLDDYFGIWTHSEDDFQTFFNILNTQAPSIKLKSVINHHSIDFLDVTIYKGKRFEEYRELDTKVFFKDTDTHELLHKQSFHPKHVFSGVLKSQIIRFHRICNNQSDFQNACNTLFSVLLKRQYSKRFIRKVKSNALTSLDSSLNGFISCQNAKCIACKFAPSKIKSFTSYKTGEKYEINQVLTCTDKDVVYVLSCQKCNLQYVGETSLTIRNRLSGHLYTIRNNDDTPVSKHFNSIPHTIENDLKIHSIQKTHGAPHRKSSESDWIRKLETLSPSGLNQQYAPANSFNIPFIIPYCNRGNNLSQLIKTKFEDLQMLLPHPYRNVKLVTAFERNKNLKEYLVHTKYN